VENRYTPGPWTVGFPWKVTEPGRIIGADSSKVATVHRTAGDVDANAALIAAAPELLEALMAVRPAFKHLSETYEPDNSRAGLLSDICEAIAKATRT